MTAEVQEAAPPGGFQGKALTFFLQPITLPRHEVRQRVPRLNVKTLPAPATAFFVGVDEGEA